MPPSEVADVSNKFGHVDSGEGGTSLPIETKGGKGGKPPADLKTSQPDRRRDTSTIAFASVDFYLS